MLRGLSVWTMGDGAPKAQVWHKRRGAYKTYYRISTASLHRIMALSRRPPWEARLYPDGFDVSYTPPILKKRSAKYPHTP